MEDLSKYTNLHRRNGRYYFRVRVPLDLINALGKNEIKKSLNTAELSEARSRLPIEQLRADDLFHATRKKLAVRTAAKSISNNLSKDEIERRVILWFHEEAQRQARQDDADRIGIDEFERELILDNLHLEQAALDTDTESTYQHIITPVLKELFGSDASQAATRLASSLIHQGQIELLYRRLARFGERHDEHTPYSLFMNATHGRQSNADSDSISWGELLEKFKAEKIRAGKTQKTMNGYRLTFSFTLEFFKYNKPVTAITREDCRNYSSALSKLPANAKKRFPRLSLLDAIEAASGAPEMHLSQTSVSGNLAKLSTILEFAVMEGYITRNPARKIELAHDKVSQQEKRQPFDETALNLIFSAPIYTGCIDDEYAYHKPGPNKPRRHRFWIPLIALYTGMRLNEICQLFSSDIDTKDGIPIIHVRVDEGKEKSLKNPTSARIIPIHRELVELGLLEYAATIKAQGHKQLFPHLTKSATGSLSDAFSKWFNRFLRAAGVKAHHNKMVFHSFRHTFRDATREARIPKDIVAALGGWKNSDDEMDKYGNGHPLKTFDEELQKIKHPLKLLHLKS